MSLSFRLELLCAATVLGLGGCGSSGNQPQNTDGGMDAVADLAGPAADLALIPLTPLPEVNANNGAIIASPKLVTITFSDTQYAKEAEGLGDFVFGSQWWKAVASEYGISGGTHVQKVAIPMNAFATITDADLITWIKQKIADGTLPSPLNGNDGILYMIYFSEKGLVSDDSGTLCVDYAGYHWADTYMGHKFTYAVIGDCMAGPEDVQNTATHELLEVATDPYERPAGYYLSPAEDDPWIAMDQDEVADLCWDSSNFEEGGFFFTRSWSNAAAKAGTDPCVPAVGGVYQRVYVASPVGVPTVKAGQTIEFILAGWASEDTAPWTLSLEDADSTTLYLQDQNAVLSDTKIARGGTVKLTVTVPRTAVTGDVGGFLVRSGPNQYISPVAYYVQ